MISWNFFDKMSDMVSNVFIILHIFLLGGMAMCMASAISMCLLSSLSVLHWYNEEEEEEDVYTLNHGIFLQDDIFMQDHESNDSIGNALNGYTRRIPSAG